MGITVHTISIGEDNVIYNDIFVLNHSPISINTALVLIELKRKIILHFYYIVEYEDTTIKSNDMEYYIDKVNKILERA